VYFRGSKVLALIPRNLPALFRKPDDEGPRCLYFHLALSNNYCAGFPCPVGAGSSWIGFTCNFLAPDGGG
jgi:hypothetical protein